ncbi:MAG TPA: acetylxylan esterase, partial [Fimbriimonas sp.]
FGATLGTMDATLLNRMLENRVKDLAGRKPARNRSEHEERVRSERDAFLRCLGLYPLPPRTDLQATLTGTLQREGYRIEKIAYFSRPGVRVTAHLYLPESAGKAPVVLCPHGHWTYKKSEPVVQAQGIGLALQGIAAFVIDSPGFSWDDNEINERRAMGPHDDPLLTMSLPVQGVYVWDVLRGIDYLSTRVDIDLSKVGIAGASGGGTTTVLAFAADERIQCAAPICYATSLEDNPQNGCLCNHLPGIALLGDRSDWLALACPRPVMLIGAQDDPEFPPQGHRRTHEKLRAIYHHYRAEESVRLELFEGPHDMNRRMREAALAFFAEHLQGEPRRPYLAEKRPLTDGANNPYPANTMPPESPELLVLNEYERSRTTFRDLLQQTLAEPYPAPFHASERLVRWGRFGRLPELKPTSSLTISDQSLDDALVLPVDDVDQRLCLYSGLSVPEFLAQVLHLLLPGGPEGWESVAMGGDVITSMIASMKTLVSASTPVPLLEKLVAHGPVSSMVALHLRALRPTIEVQTSHAYKSWSEMESSVLAMPQARYLAWPE